MKFHDFGEVFEEIRQAVVTGTGFPRVFYLSYHLYRNYFPLLALTDYRRAMERA